MEENLANNTRSTQNTKKTNSENKFFTAYHGLKTKYIEQNRYEKKKKMDICDLRCALRGGG